MFKSFQISYHFLHHLSIYIKPSKIKHKIKENSNKSAKHLSYIVLQQQKTLKKINKVLIGHLVNQTQRYSDYNLYKIHPHPQGDKMQPSNNNHPTNSNVSATGKQTQRIVRQVTKCRTPRIFSRLVNMTTTVIKFLFAQSSAAPHTRPVKRDVHLNSTEAIHNWLAMIDRPQYSDAVANSQAGGGGASVGNSE